MSKQCIQEPKGLTSSYGYRSERICRVQYLLEQSCSRIGNGTADLPVPNGELTSRNREFAVRYSVYGIAKKLRAHRLQTQLLASGNTHKGYAEFIA